jgi:hypothetical protein
MNKYVNSKLSSLVCYKIKQSVKTRRRMKIRFWFGLETKFWVIEFVLCTGWSPPSKHAHAYICSFSVCLPALELTAGDSLSLTANTRLTNNGLLIPYLSFGSDQAHNLRCVLVLIWWFVSYKFVLLAYFNTSNTLTIEGSDAKRI